MIPDELKPLRQWIVWEYRERDGKRTKVPLDPKPTPARESGLASSTDPETWGTFAEALVAFDAEGLGFVFTDLDPYLGLDLDACVNGAGAIHPDAHRIVDTLDSYTEFSPSGYGLHIIVRATLPRGRKTSATPWNGALEAYDRGRFFSVTGNGYGTIRNAQREVDALYARYWPDPGEKPAVTRREPVCGDDRDVLEAMFRAKNGGRIRTLYEQGWEAAGYGSGSEADLALCGDIEFHCGNDAATIDRIFRGSALMRDKWDEKRGDSTYGAITIRRLIEG